RADSSAGRETRGGVYQDCRARTMQFVWACPGGLFFVVGVRRYVDSVPTRDRDGWSSRSTWPKVSIRQSHSSGPNRNRHNQISLATICAENSGTASTNAAVAPISPRWFSPYP